MIKTTPFEMVFIIRDYMKTSAGHDDFCASLRVEGYSWTVKDAERSLKKNTHTEDSSQVKEKARGSQESSNAYATAKEARQAQKNSQKQAQATKEAATKAAAAKNSAAKNTGNSHTGSFFGIGGGGKSVSGVKGFGGGSCFGGGKGGGKGAGRSGGFSR